MNPVLVGFLAAGCVFVGGLTGLFLQHRLPSHHLSKEMQDLVKLSAGMIGTLTALVLGLLVSSAKSSFDAVATGIVQGGAKVIYLDRTLARVGPETGPVREQLKRSLAAGIAAVLACAGCDKPNDAITRAAEAEKSAARPVPDLEEIKTIAEEGFVYGLPLVMCYTAAYEFWVDKTSGQYKSPMNQLFNERRVFTYRDTAVVTPNSDTPYSFACLDLRAEPFVVSVPAVEKERYYSVQLVDWNTFNSGYIGSRATGPEAGNYLVAGPGWKGDVPPGINKVFRSSTDFAITLFRTQLFDAADMPNVIKVQDSYRIQPLSAFQQKPAPAPAPEVRFAPASAEIDKTGFFEVLDFVLQFAPAGPDEAGLREKLARIGVGPGKTFAFKDLSDAHKAAVLVGMKRGLDRVEKKVAAIGRDVNGWRVAMAFGDRDFFHGDWLLRAAAAKAGIFGNDPVEAMYPMARTTAAGEVVDTGKGDYAITFPPGELPPVNAFWSVTMYDGKSQLLIENPLNRYLINSPMLPDLKRNADGSLTIYVQKSSPGPDRESNWLPAPDGPAYLVMRLYWPKTEAPSILNDTWKVPPITPVETSSR